MKVILSALKAEAFPLINYYKLIPSNSIGLQMYRNDLFTMLITGVGKKNVNKTLKEYLKKTKNIEEAKFIKQRLNLANARADRPILASCFCRLSHNAA